MNKGRRLTIEVVFFIFLVGVLYFVLPDRDASFWPKGRVDVDSGNRLVMGTFARIIAVAIDSGTANNCVEAAFEELKRIDELMSDYKSDSELSEVNREGFEKEVKVSEALFDVLKRSAAYSRETGGAFDITVGPLVDLGRWAEEKGQALGEEEILRARERVGFEKLELDEMKRTVRFSVEGMRLDLGGIAKGYAIDKAIEAMQGLGAIGGMVDVGGDIRCFGAPPEGKRLWLVGLQDPHEGGDVVGAGKLLLVLRLANGAIATSGDYRRFSVIDGKRYSHIIDTQTGHASEGLSSVTIIAKEATLVDALATAVSVLGAQKGLELIERQKGVEGVLITSGPKYEVLKSSGVGKYIE